MKLQLIGVRTMEIRNSDTDSVPTLIAYRRVDHFKSANFQKQHIWRTLPPQFQYLVTIRNITSTNGDVLR